MDPGCRIIAWQVEGESLGLASYRHPDGRFVHAFGGPLGLFAGPMRHEHGEHAELLVFSLRGGFDMPVVRELAE
jgi:hypothetical protein